MYRIMQMLCMWFFILVIIFHFIPLSIMPHPIKHMWSSTVTTPLMHLPYLFTHSPAPALTIPHLPLQDNLPHARWTMPLTPSTAPPGHLCPCSHLTPCSIHCAPRAVYAHTCTSPLTLVGTPKLDYGLFSKSLLHRDYPTTRVLSDHLQRTQCHSH